MSKIEMAWFELILIDGLGLLFFLIGFLLNHRLKKRNQECTEHVEGIVKKYRFRGNGKFFPIVEYWVNGICYKEKKKFFGFKTTSVSGFPISVQTDAYEDEKGWLHVKRGAITNYRGMAEQLWPIGSKMIVFYNPKNPKKCYVDRPLPKSPLAFALFAAGVGYIILGTLVFFLMHL